jgi:hypothetical protein
VSFNKQKMDEIYAFYSVSFFMGGISGLDFWSLSLAGGAGTDAPELFSEGDDALSVHYGPVCFYCVSVQRI